MVFRWLVGNWLRSAARQRVRETVVQTARERLIEAAEAPDSEEPAKRERPCDVGVVFALGIEAGGLEDLLDGAVSIRGHGFAVRQGGLKGRHLVVVQSGAGCEAASHATEALLSGHQPQWVISAGFAGGLVPLLKRHDIVMTDSVVNAAGRRLGIDLKIDADSLPPGMHVGRILSVDQIVRLPKDKQSLGSRHEALAVDLESFAVAEVCHRRGVRFLGVRIITDAMDEQLPVDIQNLTDQPTAASRLGAAFGAVCRRPSSVKDMLQLKENALVGSDRLAHFLDGMIRQLTPLDGVHGDGL